MPEKLKLRRRKPKLRLRRRKLEEGQRVNIGVEVDGMLWKKFRIYCLETDQLAGDLLDKLMANHLKKQEKRMGDAKITQ